METLIVPIITLVIVFIAVRFILKSLKWIFKLLLTAGLTLSILYFFAPGTLEQIISAEKQDQVKSSIEQKLGNLIDKENLEEKAKSRIKQGLDTLVINTK